MKKKLAGKKILLTCTEEAFLKASKKVKVFGGEIEYLPMLKIKKISLNCEKIVTEGYDWVVVSSPTSAQIFIEQIKFTKHKPKFLVCGIETAKIFADYAIDLVFPLEFSANGIFEKAKEIIKPCEKILRVRSDLATDNLSKKLAEINFKVDDIITYFVEPIKYKCLPYFDAIIFASRSAVVNFFESFSLADLKNKKIIVIGKPTKIELLKFCEKETTIIKDIFSAKLTTIESCIDKLTEVYGGG